LGIVVNSSGLNANIGRQLNTKRKMENTTKNSYQLLCEKYGKEEIKKFIGGLKEYSELIIEHGTGSIAKELSDYFKETRAHFYPED
jgi:hypothetical protein